jgi:hypothetical protein
MENLGLSSHRLEKSVTDGELLDMVNQLETGQADADLGGGSTKVRAVRPGAGKSGG